MIATAATGAEPIAANRIGMHRHPRDELFACDLPALPTSKRHAARDSVLAGLQFNACVANNLMAQIVRWDFELGQLPAAAAVDTATLRFSGRLVRGPLVVVAASGATVPLADALIRAPGLQRAARTLDLRAMTLRVADKTWQLRIGLVGAARVRIRPFGLERYIPMGRPQAVALVETFEHAREILSRF